MALNDAKLPTLRKKLEEKQVLEKQLADVDEAIDKITKPIKVKITKKNKK